MGRTTRKSERGGNLGNTTKERGVEGEEECVCVKRGTDVLCARRNAEYSRVGISFGFVCFDLISGGNWRELKSKNVEEKKETQKRGRRKKKTPQSLTRRRSGKRGMVKFYLACVRLLFSLDVFFFLWISPVARVAGFFFPFSMNPFVVVVVSVEE